MRRNPFLEGKLFGDRIHASVAIEILLSRGANVLWKIVILCAFPGSGVDFRGVLEGKALESARIPISLKYKSFEPHRSPRTQRRELKEVFSADSACSAVRRFC